MGRRSISQSDVDNYHAYGLFVPTHTVRFCDKEGDTEVTQASAHNTMRNLDLLAYRDPDRPITLYLSTEGGSIDYGAELYSHIRDLQCPVYIVCNGPCWSMGAVILQAGTRRLLGPNCSVMLHRGRASSPDGLDISNYERWLIHERKQEEQLDYIVLSKIQRVRPDFTIQKLHKKMTLDWIMDAQEAVKWGIADDVI